MNSNVKKALMGVGIAVGVVALVFAGLTIFRNVSRKPVDVYPVMYLGQTDWDSYATTTYGMATSEGIQKVFLTEQQTVTEVLVTPGQEVHVGDPLLALDATLASLDLKKAEIAMGKAELAVQQAKADLALLRSLRPHSSRLVIPESTVTYTPHSTPYIIMGNGLKGDPFIILWSDGADLSITYMRQLIAEYASAADENAKKPEAPEPAEGESAEAPAAPGTTRIEDDGACYVILITRQNDSLEAPILKRYGLRIAVTGDSPAAISFYTPIVPDSVEAYVEIPQPYYEESGSYYTAAELTQLRAEKEQEVARLEIEAGLARIDFEKRKQEADDGFVRATIDGVVTSVVDPDKAKGSGQAVVTVSDGGGYRITGTCSEFDLGTLRVGQSVLVTVYDWSRGGMQTATGTIEKIVEFPTESTRWSSDTNSSASTYPFTVFVDGSTDISDSSYVEIQYGSASEGSSLYLPNAFIRTEGGSSFVYVLGEDGRLEQRTVSLGRDLWGSYTQIRAGVTMDDYIAFPYGNDVFAGAKTTVQEDLTSLYQGVYY